MTGKTMRLVWHKELQCKKCGKIGTTEAEVLEHDKISGHGTHMVSVYREITLKEYRRLHKYLDYL